MQEAVRAGLPAPTPDRPKTVKLKSKVGRITIDTSDWSDVTMPPEMWRKAVVSQTAEWTLCRSCAAKVRRYLPRAKPWWKFWEIRDGSSAGFGGKSSASQHRVEPAAGYPPGIKNKAELLAKQNTPEQNRRELGVRVQSQKWLDAFPFALAETIQTRNAVALKYVGVCFLKLAESAAANGHMTDVEKAYLASAISTLDTAIDAGESDWDALQYRGSAHLIAAQVRRDRNAIDQAERDFRASLAIQPSDMVKRNLKRVEQVRKILG
jgi:hypothetical protein